MSIIDTLITDRTAADVQRAEYFAGKAYADMTDAERAEWDAGLRGAYNAADLNRVGAAIRYIAERINSFGTSVRVSPKTDWADGDTPTPAQLAAYLDNISVIRGVLDVMQSTPAVPEDLDSFTYEEANNIEQILADVDLLATNISRAWFYSGEIYSGEV